MNATVARPVSNQSAAPVIGILILLAVAFAIFASVQSYRNFNAAAVENPWLRWASDQREFKDYFRFAFSSTDEVATELAPAAVRGIDALPLAFSPESKASDGTALVRSLNDINPACAHSSLQLVACGDAAIARRHSTLERALADSSLGADYWIERKGRKLAFLQLLELSVHVCGLTPYRTETALMVRSVDGYGKSGVTNWHARTPGQCSDETFGKYHYMPEVFAYTRSADDQTIGLLREDPGYAATWAERPVTWGSDGSDARHSCVGSTSEPSMTTCGAFDTKVGFRSVKLNRAGGEVTGTWLVADPGLCAPECAWGQEGDQMPLEALQRHAQQLASLLVLRKAYRSEYGDARPYIIGVEVDDDNGPYRAGIRIKTAPALTPLGVQSPFRSGDVITELAGVPIFSLEDLRLALAKFVTTVGADQTYRYQYWRYDQARSQMVKYEGSGTAHFDPEYWLSHGYSGAEVQALMHGLFNAVSFGWYRSIGCAVKRVFAVVPSYTLCKIAAANEWMLMRQLYPSWYSWGAIPAMLFSPVQALLGVAGVAVSSSASLAIELLESGMSAVANRLPGEGIEITAGQFASSVVVGRLTTFATPLVRRLAD